MRKEAEGNLNPGALLRAWFVRCEVASGGKNSCEAESIVLFRKRETGIMPRAVVLSEVMIDAKGLT